MNKILFTIACMATITLGQAQNNQGQVSYEEKRKLNIVIDSAQAAMMANPFPKEDISKSILLFTPAASYYQYDETGKKENAVEHEEGGGRMMINIQKPDNKFYRDLENKKFIQQREFMGRKFLINSDIKAPDWKLTGNQKKILDYVCMEATRQEDDKKITAWFAPAIPVSTGPSLYGNLPGLVLAVSVNDGDLTITATDVAFKAIDEKLLMKPTEGKKVTEEEFKKIVDEKTKEMQAENGGSGNVIIKINTDDHH